MNITNLTMPLKITISLKKVNLSTGLMRDLSMTIAEVYRRPLMFKRISKCLQFAIVVPSEILNSKSYFLINFTTFKK